MPPSGRQVTGLVIPCYNEQDRIDEAAVLRLAAVPRLQVFLVDDGSSDGTFARLTEICGVRSRKIQVIRLPHNVGKGEAVRAGMQRAISQGCERVGYLDADFATPGSEWLRLQDSLRAPVDVVMGARIQRLGSDVKRHPVRHYLGRVFATAASVSLGVRVYDTQCGAKLFRVTPALEHALRTPFMSRWIFDVELLSRLLKGTPGMSAIPSGNMVEIPLDTWHDIRGSKVSFRAMSWAVLELCAVAWRRRS